MAKASFRLALACSGMLLLAAPRAAADETRLGTLIRAYLGEERPSRQFELIDQIDRLVGGDVGKVAEAIRRCEHCRFSKRPVLATGGTPPVFSPQRHRVQPVAAGDYAVLALPPDYDPARAHPLVVDLGAGDLPAPAGAVQIKVDVTRHPQGRSEAMAAEALVLSILAQVVETVHVDAGRVFLRAQVGSAAALAWYLAIHNPDRFAGLLTLQGYWPGAARLAPNTLRFSVLSVEPRQGNPALRAFFSLDARLVHHRLLPFPRDKDSILPALAEWQAKPTRERHPPRLELVLDRPVATRAWWLRVASRRRSIQRDVVARQWKHESTAIPGKIIAAVDRKDRNLIHVDTYRVAAFHLYVDPAMFDPERPLRVSINGGVPIANLIDHNLRVATMLEDYRERRDTELLYGAVFSFSVRHEPARPPR